MATAFTFDKLASAVLQLAYHAGTNLKQNLIIDFFFFFYIVLFVFGFCNL